MSGLSMLEKAEQASTILQSEVFAEVFADLDRECVQNWRKAETHKDRDLQHTRQRMLFEIRHEILKRISAIADWERKNVPVADERGWCKLLKTLKEIIV